MKAVFQQSFSPGKIIKVTTLTQGFVLKLVSFCGKRHKKPMNNYINYLVCSESGFHIVSTKWLFVKQQVY